MGEKIGSMGRDGEGQRFLALAVSKFRAENCFALGMGLGALYAGLVPNYGKLIPAAAISFWMYELLKQQFDLN